MICARHAPNNIVSQSVPRDVVNEVTSTNVCM